MYVVIFGPPGAGKGTQAAFIYQHYKIPHISTGELFREHILKQTDIGIRAQLYAESGNLVPDEITNEMVRNRLQEEDCGKGFLLDGYPRTFGQLHELENILSEKSVKLDAVINLIVPDEEIIKRLELRGRSDDVIETRKRRLKIYHNTTKSLLGYYRDHRLLCDIQGVGLIEEITAKIFRCLNHHKSV